MKRRTFITALIGAPLVGVPAVRALAHVAPTKTMRDEAILALLKRKIEATERLMKKQLEESLWDGPSIPHPTYDEIVATTAKYEWKQVVSIHGSR